MSLDEALRATLTESAQRCDVPLPDVAAMTAGGYARRRRHRVQVVAFVVLAIMSAGAAVALGERGTRPALDPVNRPSPGEWRSTVVPWCVPDADDADGGELVVGAGDPVETPCSYQGPAQHAFLFHHARSTVLGLGAFGVYRVADGSLTRLGTHDGEDVRFSHDGRYVAWESSAPTNCGAVTVDVYEVATATEVAATVVPRYSCSHLHGIDDLGRVYVSVGDERPRDSQVLMYDIWTREWAEVVGLPARTGVLGFNYVIADGFAMSTDEQVLRGCCSVSLASVEGGVDERGFFVTRRDVPIGQAWWSPDRSLVAEQEVEGLFVRPADDLTAGVLLDLPHSSFAVSADNSPGASVQWESPDTVLVSRIYTDGAYRCNAHRGSCEAVERIGWPAFANNVGLPK